MGGAFVHDDSWDTGFGALAQYVAVRGTAKVPARAMARGVDLGQWVASCRERYWASQLTDVQVALLEALPGWTWNGAAAREWHRSLAGLHRYAARHDASAIPLDAVIAAHRIGVWVGLQRSAYAAGALSADRIALLEKVPGWKWFAVPRWERGLAALIDYVAANGTADVPAADVFADFALGHWVDRQRENHRAGSLTSPQERALLALPGWRWAATEELWRKGFEALLSYVEEAGTAAVPQRARVGDVSLGSWVNQCRRSFKMGTLRSFKVRQLQALPGWQWSPQDDAWQVGLDLLRSYVAESGHAHPARSLRYEDFPLGEWVSRQRTRHRAGRLNAQRAADLGSVPGWSWDHPPQ